MASNCPHAVFSGHETFCCKCLWLKKGYNYVKSGKSFSDEDAVVSLGVGKNMVSSIRHWLRSFGLIDSEGKPTAIADYLFDDNKGADPYIEDIGTLWLLHWNLISTDYATLYTQVFQFFQRERKEFTKDNLFSFLKRKHLDKTFGNMVWNDNTINKDISTLLRMYVLPEAKVIEDYSSLLLDLELIKRKDREYFEFNYATNAKVDPLIFFFAIRDYSKESQIVEFDKLLDLARVFCLSQNELYEIFNSLHSINSNITFDNSAGEQLFTIREDMRMIDVLDMYYK